MVEALAGVATMSLQVSIWLMVEALMWDEVIDNTLTGFILING